MISSLSSKEKSMMMITGVIPATYCIITVTTITVIIIVIRVHWRIIRTVISAL
jgi:hypothetical protein